MPKLFRKICYFFFTLAILVLPFFPSIQQAQAGGVNPQEQFKKVLKAGNLIQGQDVPPLQSATGTVINTILALLGVVTFVFIIYAGALWVTASGNEEQVKKAKGILTGSVIGLIIIFSAYFVVNFALEALQSATEGSRVQTLG